MHVFLGCLSRNGPDVPSSASSFQETDKKSSHSHQLPVKLTVNYENFSPTSAAMYYSRQAKAARHWTQCCHCTAQL